jgi:hypothetical protein
MQIIQYRYAIFVRYFDRFNCVADSGLILVKNILNAWFSVQYVVLYNILQSDGHVKSTAVYNSCLPLDSKYYTTFIRYIAGLSGSLTTRRDQRY